MHLFPLHIRPVGREGNANIGILAKWTEGIEGILTCKPETNQSQGLWYIRYCRKKKLA